MVPTLHRGDLLIVFRSRSVRPGDLVMARRPDRPRLLIVKRVLAREKDGWWLEGDNPNPLDSDDSRVFGTVPDACIVGRVVLRYMSLRPRAQRGMP